MVRATLSRFWAWAVSKWPALRAVLAEWWDSIGDKPRAHFISMLVGMAIYLAVKLAVVALR